MFTISQAGTREGVIDFIKAAKATPPETDQSQLERVKGLLIAEIEALPAEFNSCRVDANGDAQNGGRNVQFSILPMKLAIRAK